MKKSSRRDADQSRGAILDAAEDLFARLGFDRVSLAGISERAGVSRGLPSYFFADKRTLYRTVMERAAAQNRRTVLDVVRSMESNEPRRVLLKLIDRYIEYLAASPRLVRLLQWEALETTTERASDGASGVPPRVFREASKVVSERIGTKRINGMDVAELLLSIVAMCLYPFQVMPTGKTKRRAFIRRHKDHVSTIARRVIGANL